LELNFESWATIEDEALVLMEQHHREVGIARPVEFRPDTAQARVLCAAGALATATVRKDGKLIGYCMWFFSSDLESVGMLIASQGPFFVTQAERKSRAGLLLLDFSIEKFREFGIDNVMLHHWTGGAGERLGKKFARMGAVPLESVWSLWLGTPRAQNTEK